MQSRLASNFQSCLHLPSTGMTQASSLGASSVPRGPVSSAHGQEPLRKPSKTRLAQGFHSTLKRGNLSAGQSPGRFLHRKCLMHGTRMTAQGTRASYESSGEGPLSTPRSRPLPSHIPLLCPLNQSNLMSGLLPFSSVPTQWPEPP